MKKVLLLDLTPFYGGGQKFIFNVQNNLLNETHLIVSNTKLYNDLQTSRKLLLTIESLPAVIKIVNKYIKDNGIHTVLLNGNRPVYLAPFIKVPYKIAYRHTSNRAIPLSRRFAGALVLNLSYFFCSKIVLLFQNAKKEVWFQKEKVEIINNGIELPEGREIDLKSKDPDLVKVVCISRLDANKGIDWLIDVFAQTFKNNEKVSLEIAGSGEMFDYLDNKLKSSEIYNIKLLGFINNIDHLLSNSDIFVLPSKFEAFPLSILEAMAYALPVIATDTGGVPDMVKNGENGFVVDYKNDTQLANALIKLTTDAGLKKNMGNASQMFVKNKFSFQKSMGKLTQILSE